MPSAPVRVPVHIPVHTSLAPTQWAQRAERHLARARELTAAARERRERGIKHPVEDFLYDYYVVRPGQLQRWEPGAGVAVAEPEDDPQLHRTWTQLSQRRRYRVVHPSPGPRLATLDTEAFLAERRELVRGIDRLLRATAARPPALGCLGLHEWAMVYRQDAHRHPLPLRLGQQGTDEVVEASTLRCTHVDAYRFFTPAATPRNRYRLTRQTQVEFDQPGCVHATMDLFKWALKLGPAVPGELLLDCFERAKTARVLDMEASPYDCRELGYGVVPIETAEGRAEYIQRQREVAERGAVLRERLMEVTGTLLGGGPGQESKTSPVT